MNARGDCRIVRACVHAAVRGVIAINQVALNDTGDLINAAL